ncbi:GNAT family N-acetyltransferase [Fusibacter sp. JL216-2]|uniref:GNAT family N-acetyltransferase n=1 Tax=Fusibacter sp. JL216-2 TaxID=3071453 RepID=UPI003D3425CB
MFKILTVEDINHNTVEHLLNFTYKESIQEILKESYLEESNSCNYENAVNKLREDYYSFIDNYVHSINRNQLIAVYEHEGKFVSALRAVEMTNGIWLEEALESAVEYRNQGFSTRLLYGLLDYLKTTNGKILIANIGKSNTESRNLHRKLGFIETDKVACDEDGNEYYKQIRYEYSI